MKWLVVLLLIVNVAYLGWRLQHVDSAAAMPRPVPEEPNIVNRLLLLDEVDRSELRERGARSPAVAAAVPETSAVTTEAFVPAPPDAVQDDRICYSVGPLEDVAEVERMRDWLAGKGGEFTLREDERRELSLYWVYFPPYPTRKAAEEQVEGMRAKGLADIYIIPRGDMANAISLGVYSHRVSLERRLRALRSNGYEPSIAPRYKTKRASWFDVEFVDDFVFPQDTFANLFPTAEMSPAACAGPPIARDRPLPYNSLGPRHEPDSAAAEPQAVAPPTLPAPEPEPDTEAQGTGPSFPRL